MAAREFDCEVKSVVWLSPYVFSLVFEPAKAFAFEPGQFVSVVLPRLPTDPRGREVRRIYSLATSGKKAGYELCVQLHNNGRGSQYLASLKPGERFRISAPYGDFRYETTGGRNAVFIATSTGIAPFKAMVTSELFDRDPPGAAAVLLGVRDERDILYPGLFEKYDVNIIPCLSRPSPAWRGFKGRVTDYLANLPDTWPWGETDFYICGGGGMIEEVRYHLINVRRVHASAIRQEAYFAATEGTRYPSEFVIPDRRAA